MPCYDPPPPSRWPKGKLQAMLCAVCHYLTKEGKIEEAVTYVYDNEKLNLDEWFTEHTQKDINRLKTRLREEFTDVERSILKGLLTEENDDERR